MILNAVVWNFDTALKFIVFVISAIVCFIVFNLVDWKRYLQAKSPWEVVIFHILLSCIGGFCLGSFILGLLFLQYI